MPILTHGAETLTRNKADIRKLIHAEIFWKYRRKNQEQKKHPITTFHGDLLFVLFWHNFLKI
jgi:hypothetical protein